MFDFDRMRGIFIRLMVTILIFSQNAAEIRAEQAGVKERLPPLIEFSISNEISFLIEYSFVLKHRAKHFPISTEDANQSFVKGMETGRKIADRADKAAVNDLYDVYHHLYDIYQFLGKLSWDPQVEGKIQEMRQLIYRIGEWIYLKENREEQRRQIRVSYLALGLGQSAYHQDAIRELLGMKDQVPKQYRSSIHLLAYYHLSSAESTLATAQKYLQTNQKELTRYERKIITLIQARIDAGVIGQQKSGPTKPDIGKILMNLSEQVKRSRYEGVRHRIEGTILDTWVMINQNIDWRRIPLADVTSRSLEMPAGLLERMVLEDIREGQVARGIQVYTKLAQDFAGKPVVAKIDLRRLRLTKSYVEQTKQYDSLLKTYTVLMQKYSQKNAGPDARLNQQMYGTLFRDFENYAIDLLKNAAQANVTAEHRLATITVGEAFIKQFANQRAAVKPVKALLAQVLDLVGKPTEAVQIFLDLAKDEAASYLPLAILSQMKAARWPAQPPWLEVRAEARQERTALVKLLEDYSNHLTGQKKPLDWHNLAHLGLLYQHLGAAQKVEALWQGNLKHASSGDASHGAFGILLMTYFKAEQWDRLIEVFQLAEQRSVIPSFENRPMNSEAIYQAALLRRAHASQEQKKMPEALADYTSFVNRFKQDQRRPVALFQMVQIHRQLDQLDLAVGQIKVMIQEYPNLPLTKRAMLEGGQWAQSAAGGQLKNAAFLYQSFVEVFASDPLMPRARFQLAHVQMELQSNSSASQNFRAHALDNRVANPERVRAALNHIRLEAGPGDLGRALAEMETVIRMADRAQTGDFISAHVILARIATEKQQLQQMNQHEGVLLPYVKNRKDVAEAIGMLRLARAQARGYEIPFSQNMETVESYRTSVETIYNRFVEITKAYDLVCKEGDNSLCHQAYVRTKQFAQDAMDATGSLMVGNNVDPKQVEHLRSLQSTHLTKLKEFFDYYSRMADKYESFQAPNIPAGIIAAH